MKKIIFILILSYFSLNIFASDFNVENLRTNTPKATSLTEDNEILPLNQNSPRDSVNTIAPGRIPSFWFAFVISTIGTYTLYGIGAGPIAVVIVYLTSSGSKKETWRAFWGCLAGFIVGGSIKLAVLYL